MTEALYEEASTKTETAAVQHRRISVWNAGLASKVSQTSHLKNIKKLNSTAVTQLLTFQTGRQN